MALAKGLKMTSKWSILIVDDEFGVRESLRILLKPHYKIFAAPNGEEALKILRERKIDLITLDLNMPKLSGIDTLREIRKIDGEVPVIIVTGYGTQKDEKEALLYGVRDFISKPFNIKEIVSAIDGILEERIEQESGPFKKKTRKV
jgi:two-component system response regulator (stage 0 sporulation protein F)